MSKTPDQPAIMNNADYLPDGEILYPITTEPDYLNGETCGASTIEKLRQDHQDAYNKAEAARFEEARQVAQQRLDNLSKDGFSDYRGPLDELATADSIEKHIEYDFEAGSPADSPKPAGRGDTAQHKHEISKERK
jgi:hypothetical protein